MNEREERIRQHWEDPATVSLADENLRRLETAAVTAWLRPAYRALDLGCGDGVNTMDYAGHVQQMLGVDYSQNMLERARARLAQTPRPNLEFRQLTVSEAKGLETSFDVVITQRCLINLTTWQEQKAALVQVRGLLKESGRYLMLESVEQGRVRLNQLRERLGLKPLAMPWHNRFLEEDELDPVLRELFVVEARHDFSLYYLISRVLAPSLGLDHTATFSKQMDQAAGRLQQALGLGELTGIGPQRLYVLRRR